MITPKLPSSTFFNFFTHEHQLLKHVAIRSFGTSKCCKPTPSSPCRSASADCMNQKMVPFMNGCQDYMSKSPQTTCGKSKKQSAEKGTKKNWKRVFLSSFLLGFASFVTIACLSSTFDPNACKKDK